MAKTAIEKTKVEDYVTKSELKTEFGLTDSMIARFLSTRRSNNGISLFFIFF